MDAEAKLKALGQESGFEADGDPPAIPLAPGRRRTASADGSLPAAGLYRLSTPKGQKTHLRTLFTSACHKNCGYCPFGRDRSFRRTAWKRDELARTVSQLSERGQIQGLFLTSGLAGDARKVMDLMLDSLTILRRKYNYSGYLHIKLLPGATPDQVEEALRYADRVSVNLEAPTDSALGIIAPEKILQTELTPHLHTVARAQTMGLAPAAGMVTQFVVGPGGETDRTLIQAASRLYGRYRLRRVYYSGFIPVKDTPLADTAMTDPMRQHRLYQADWLMRFYGFKGEELPFDSDGNLPVGRDPKESWARLHPERFPLEVNTASREALVRVPGIGPQGADRLVALRRQGKVRDLLALKASGIDVSRAGPWLLLDGKRGAPILVPDSPPVLQQELFPGTRFVSTDGRKIDPARGGTYQ